MKKPNLRSHARIPTSLRGTITLGTASFPCLVIDMSDGGFHIMPTVTLDVGQVVTFRCELYPGRSVDCQLEIRHVGEDGVGTRIREIDEQSARLCQLYLQEHYADRLDRST